MPGIACLADICSVTCYIFICVCVHINHTHTHTSIKPKLKFTPRLFPNMKPCRP